MGGRISKGYNGADGNLSRQSNPDGSGQSYFFNGRDQLSAVEMKKAGGALSHRSEFSYDGFGRLVKSREFVRQNSAWVKQSERGRVFDGMDTIQERGAANQVLGQLTRDGNIGGVLSRRSSTGTTFFGYDGNGNVTTLSDAQGNSVGSYRYDGFGNALEVSGAAANQNSHRFSTKELHAPSGLYYYGFRFYSPALSRWINRDPIREMGGVNLYQMVGNNPTNAVDPLGLRPKPRNVNPKAWAALEEMNEDTWWRVVRSYHGYDDLSKYSHDIQHGKGNCGTSVSFDLSVRNRSKSDILNLLRKLPDYGFVGWYRHWYTTNKRGQRISNFHLHIVYAWDALQHDKTNGGSKAGDQVDSWIVGKNGLRSYEDYVHHYGDKSFGEIWTKEQVRKLRQGHEKANPSDK